jgi:hypothetical protein
LVLFVIFWVRIAGYSRQIAKPFFRDDRLDFRTEH